MAILLLPFALVGCAANTDVNTDGSVNDSKDTSDRGTYTQISSEAAAELMKTESEYIILDVRRSDEYAEGHIPGAINIPNEIIGESELTELPDKDALILVYCRSGRRSKEAAEKLVSLGYTNIVEFGGILGWTGETEK